MPDHPSWPAELVEKAERALAKWWEDYQPGSSNGEPDECDRTMARAVLSALSGDLVPREEHEAERTCPACAGRKRCESDGPRCCICAGTGRCTPTEALTASRAFAQSTPEKREQSDEVEVPWSVPGSDTPAIELVPRSQADALAEALERARNAIGAVGGAIYLMEPNQGERPDWAASRRTLVGVCDDLGESLASYRKTASGETEG